jgi:hypothetical protein
MEVAIRNPLKLSQNALFYNPKPLESLIEIVGKVLLNKVFNMIT